MKIYIAKDIEPGKGYGNPVAINLDKDPFVNGGFSCYLVGGMGAGKSNATAVFVEKMYDEMLPFIVYDWNREHAGLKELGKDVAIIGDVNHIKPEFRAMFSIKEMLEDTNKFVKLAIKGYSFVIDLSCIHDKEERVLAFARMMDTHYNLAIYHKKSVLVVVDEVQNYAPQSGANSAQKTSIAALNKMASDSRKRAILMLYTSQRTTQVKKDLISSTNIKFVGKMGWKDHFNYIKSELPRNVDYKKIMKLNPGEFYVSFNGRGGMIMMQERRTPSYGYTPKIEGRKARLSFQQQEMEFSFQVKPEYVKDSVSEF